MNAAFRRILVIAGSALVLQGALDLVLGPWLALLVGETPAAAADSDARFLGGVLVAVGAVWIVLSRRADLPHLALRLLAGGMILGAVGRMASLAVVGGVSALSIGLVIVEIASSTAVVLLSLAAAREADHPATAAVPAAAPAPTARDLAVAA